MTDLCFNLCLSHTQPYIVWYVVKSSYDLKIIKVMYTGKTERQENFTAIGKIHGEELCTNLQFTKVALEYSMSQLDACSHVQYTWSSVCPCCYEHRITRQAKIISLLVPWTWQWGHCTKIGFIVTRSQFNRWNPLGCGGTLDSHHGCGTLWCSHVNIDIFKECCWICAMENQGSFG